MIRYQTDSWFGLLFRIKGTVFPAIWYRVLGVTIYLLLAYYLLIEDGVYMGRMRGNILGHILSFLLVFRLSNAYTRYWDARTLLTNFFGDLRVIVEACLSLTKGGKRNEAWRWRRRMRDVQTERPLPFNGQLPEGDLSDDRISEERTHVIRWALVVAIALQLHTRTLSAFNSGGEFSLDSKWLVDWDRYRIRHLTTPDEFAQLDRYIRGITESRWQWDEVNLEELGDEPRSMMEQGPRHLRTFFGRLCVALGLKHVGAVSSLDIAPKLHSAAVYRLAEILVRSHDDPRIHPYPEGYPDRCLQPFMGHVHRLQKSLSTITEILAAPLAFNYFHIIKVVLVVYLLMFPFFMDVKRDFYANVVELFVLALALLGMDAIATELENPLGDDANDLDILAMIASLEKELMALASLHGDEVCRSNFVWLDVPQTVACRTSVGVKKFLALKEQVDSHGTSVDVIAESTLARRRNLKKKSYVAAAVDEGASDDSN